MKGRKADASVGVRFLLGRTTDVSKRSRRKGLAGLRFQIKHMMFLTMWTAIVLSAREPLIQSIPDIAQVIIWVSAIAAVTLIAALYGIALTMAGGKKTDSLVLSLLYVLVGDMFLLLIFLLLGGLAKESEKGAVPLQATKMLRNKAIIAPNA